MVGIYDGMMIYRKYLKGSSWWCDVVVV